MLGENIKKIRTSKKMTLRELGQLCNMSHGYISDIENGRATNPGYDKLEIIAKALDVNISALIDDNINAEASINVDEDFKELYEKIKNLDETKKTLIRNLIEEFNKNK